MSDDLSPVMTGRTLGNALEGLLRSDVWRAVEHELRQELAAAHEGVMAMGEDAHTRAERVGYWNGVRAAIDVPGRMLEKIRREGDE